MKSLKLKIFEFIALLLLPVLLLNLMQTESITVYLWWENVLGIIAVALLAYGYCNWAFSVIFKNEK